MESSKPFAIDRSLQEIKDRLGRSKNLILSSPPGTGKTTRVPLFLLESGLIPSDKCLLVLQPRRVAAKQTALYMARLLKQKIGEDVGYLIRFDSKIGPRTRIKVVTEAILNRMIEENPELPDVGMVVLDEFHERSIHTDLGIALLKEIQETLRPDLKILVMSATIDPKRIQEFLPECDYLEVSAPQYPVEIDYFGPGLKPSSTGSEIAEKVGLALEQEFRARPPEGDTLIFLPGIGEIKRTVDRCTMLARKWNLKLCELHSQTPSDEQDALFEPCRQKRLIFCTNIAETSITLENIKLVVDTGLMKEIFTDSSFGIERLLLTRISKQNATQRSGRAGRVAAGRCLRLWTRDEQLHLEESPQADIHRIDLKPILLLLSSLGNAPYENFNWFEAPPAQHLNRDRTFLFETGCVDFDGRILDLGRNVVRFSFVDTRSAVFFIQTLTHGASPHIAATAVCILENLEWFSKQTGAYDTSSLQELEKNNQSDFFHFLSLELSKHANGRSSLPEHFQILIERLERDAKKISLVREISAPSSNQNPQSVGSRGITPGSDLGATISPPQNSPLLYALLFAFYDRICRRRGQTQEALMVGGRGLTLASTSDCKRSAFFLALDPFETRIKNTLTVSCPHAHGFELSDLKKVFSCQIESKKRQITNPQLGRAQVVESLFYKDLELNDPQPATLTADEARELQLQNTFKDAKHFFSNRPKFAKFLTRIHFLHAASPKNFCPTISKLSDSELMEHLRELSESGINFEDSEDSLLSQLAPLLMSPQEFKMLNDEAPHQILVPSGSILPIEYFPLSENKAPQLDVRLQELFGMASTPKLGFGSTPLLINLLSPGYKSVQMTRDLNSFWKSTYFEVRRELKAQYPKHLWPENPESTRAQSKGGIKRGSDF